jgi:peptidoglycan/xylan/chitin deacetylase (PgdA/CDA1 family)
MRPPAGSYDNNSLKILRQLGYRLVLFCSLIFEKIAHIVN